MSGNKAITTTESAWVRWTLTAIALAFIALFLLLPLAAVFAEALRKGFDAYPTACASPTPGRPSSSRWSPPPSPCR